MTPKNIDAELAVLSRILTDEAAMDKIAGTLRPSDFHDRTNKTVYLAALKVFDNGLPVNPLTVAAQAGDKLAEVGGESYVVSLTYTPVEGRVEQYAQIVREMSAQRGLIKRWDEAREIVHDESLTFEERYGKVESLLAELMESRGQADYSHISEIIPAVVRRIEEVAANPSTVTGVPSGLADLDVMTTGFQKADFWIVAAPPSTGKTALAGCMALHAARQGTPVGFFSAEMSNESLVMRFLSLESRVESQKIRTGQLTDSEWSALMQGAARLSELPIYIDDTAGINVMQLRTKARRMAREHKIGILFVDYIQLLSGGKAESSVQEVANISKTLKSTARECKVPVIALSQFRRMNESDEGPTLQMLKGSSQLEQDADGVIFLTRDVVQASESYRADLTIAKQRNGPTGHLTVYFDPNRMFFSDLARSQ